MLIKQQLTELQRTQNKALRIVFRTRPMPISVKDMRDAAKLETLEQHRENHLLALMFDRTKEPEYRDDSARVTRRADAVMLKIPRAQTNKLTKAPIFMGSTLWNDLPTKIREAKTKTELIKLVRLN